MNDVEKNASFISAVLYVRNDEQKVRGFFTMLNRVLSANFKKYEIVVVNDYCVDDSIRILKEEAAKIPASIVSIINMSYYQGLDASMHAGTDLAIGDFIFEFDTLSVDYPESVIMEGFNKALTGYDVVSASAGSGQKITSSFFYSLFNKHANFQYQLKTERFRIVSRRAINRINTMNRTMPYRKAAYANSGLKMLNITYAATGGGVEQAGTSVKERRELAIDSLVLFTNIAFKFSLTMSIVLMVVAAAVAVYALITFATGNPVEGWTTTMLFLSFGFFGIFMVLTILVKYISLLIRMVRENQKYVIESVDKIQQ